MYLNKRMLSAGGGGGQSWPVFDSSGKKDKADKLISSNICTLEGSVLRQFRLQDQEGAVALHKKAMASVDFKSNDYKQYFESGLTNLHKYFFEGNLRQDLFVIEYKGEVVGITGLKYCDANTAELAFGRADPDKSGHHILEALTDALMWRAKELGYTCLIGYSFHGAVKHVFSKFGFVEVDRYGSNIATWVSDGDYVIKFQKDLI